WGSPKFSENFVAGQGFTVIMRAKGISADYDKVTEIELKGGDLREKLRIQTNNIINFEKSDKLDVAFPEGISALDYCIYRVTFEAGKAKVWINEVYMGEGLVSTTSSSDMGWVFGDSNSTSSYGALIDWAIWDETGAYAPGEGADIPADLVKTELEKPITAAAWTVYDASVLPADAGFSEGSSNTANGTELLEIIEDADNSGNQLLSIISGTEDKFYWSSPDFSENFVAGGGFTVVMRAKGISADYDKVTEIEMKGGDLRDKLRIQTNNIINLEKSNKLDLAFPEGISALDFVIYRITYEAGKAKVWINDIYVGEGIVTTEATEDKRWVFGDSNGSSSYGALIDWAIWDETGAYAPGEGAAIPSNLVQIELGEPVDSSMLSVSVETITLSADGGVETVAVSSNVSWTASTTADWISISPTSGENNADITITATANESFSPRQAVVVVTDGANLTSNITVSQEAQVPDGEKLTIVSVVASTEQTGNEAVNTIDGDLSNRWSGEGDGAYIDLKLDRTNTVSFIKIGLYKGSERSSMFDILTSTDGSNFNEALMNITSEITGEPMVIYDIDDVDAKYIRIIGHGNSSSAWNSFTEFEVWGFKLDTPEPVIADVTFIVDDSANKTFTGFALKGSWNTVTGEYDANWSDGAEHTMLYDDGTNGDATAGDHIWSVTLPLVADSGFNTWEWGFNDDAANWIPSANIQFTVVDGTAQTTTYIIEKDETGVDDIRNSVSFYPNPVKNQITLSVNDFTSVTVYSLSGVKLLNSIHKSFDVSNLENGIYLIKVNTSNGSILNAKFLKQ
ncbi:MAG: discoidin domain-containing protein, partial [Prolixibacteraceae bacterium]